MSKDLLFSIILHLVAVSAALIASPFEHTRKMDFGEVIKVKIASPADIQRLETPDLPPPVIPSASLEDEFVDIPLDDPRTVKDKKEIKKPEPKEKKPEQKKPQQTAQQPPEKEIETKNTAEGQMFAGATVHSRSFDYPYWFDQAFTKIQANMRNVVSSDSPLVCKVYFEVIQSGRVIIIKIVESSGISVFDESCVRAIESSAPFPPLPRDFREEVLGISLPFSTARTGN